MTLGEKLQKLRKARSLTQEELAEKVGVSRQSLSKWESDSALPDTANIILLADLFGVTTDYLLREAEAVTPATPVKEAPAPEQPAPQPVAPIVQVIPPQQKKSTPPTILVIGSVLLILGVLVWLTLRILSIVDPCHFYQGQDFWDGLQGYIRTYKLQDLYHASLACMLIGLVTDVTYWFLQRRVNQVVSDE